VKGLRSDEEDQLNRSNRKPKAVDKGTALMDVSMEDNSMEIVSLKGPKVASEGKQKLNIQ